MKNIYWKVCLEGMDYDEMEHHKWEHQCLSPSSVEFLRGLPYRVDFHECGKKISVMHYCMNEKNQYVHYTPNPIKSNLIRPILSFFQNLFSIKFLNFELIFIYEKFIQIYRHSDSQFSTMNKRNTSFRKHHFTLQNRRKSKRQSS